MALLVISQIVAPFVNTFIAIAGHKYYLPISENLMQPIHI